MHLRASGCKDLRCTETCQGFSHLAGFEFDSAEPLTPAPSVNYTWPLELGMKSGTGTEKLHFVMIYSLVALAVKAVKCSLRSLRSKSRRRLVTSYYSKHLCYGKKHDKRAWTTNHALMRFQSPTHCCGKVVEMFGEVGRRAYSGQMPRRRCSFASAGIEGAVESRPDLISMCLFVLYELIIICACDERHTTMHNYALVPLCQCCLMMFDVVCAEIQHAGDCHSWRVRVDESRFPV